jgi:DNA-binding beta-propeller fold protein YncE
MHRHARPPRGGTIALLLSALVVLVAACGPSRPPGAGQPSGPAKPGPAGYLVYAGNLQLGRLQVLGAGGVRRTLPAGVASPDWRTLYVAVAGGDRTTVEAVDAASGRVQRSLEVAGRFRLPSIGIAGVPDGISADGSTLVLASAVDAPVRRFAVLATTLDRAPALVEVAGEFEFDALSPDGSQLYLIEHLAGGDDSYRVRRYDLAAGGLSPDVIVDKRKAAETSMAGYPNTRVTDPRGTWVYTLYRNAEHGPFVHALNAQDGYAFCLDLPRQGRQDERLARLWALVRDQTGGRLYAVNTALGLVSEIDGAQPALLRSATFPPERPGAGGQPGAGSAILSPDGSLLLAGGANGVVAIDTASLEVTGRFLDGWAVDGLVASTDGKRLYVLSRARGQLATLDPASGAVLDQQPAPDVTLLLRATGA